ncbi:hypothetical protein CTI12_AA322160 [Artemisia annua]|uniref:Uncharacterized protein n=1 Tax=Artemisia annua TaxID=35608 RepID=A0A2U1N0G7_ARTAN|nr:hypothetical protein CTI12_AA322160 [Artemisia annua]
MELEVAARWDWRLGFFSPMFVYGSCDHIGSSCFKILVMLNFLWVEPVFDCMCIVSTNLMVNLLLYIITFNALEASICKPKRYIEMVHFLLPFVYIEQFNVMIIFSSSESPTQDLKLTAASTIATGTKKVYDDNAVVESSVIPGNHYGFSYVNNPEYSSILVVDWLWMSINGLTLRYILSIKSVSQFLRKQEKNGMTWLQSMKSNHTIKLCKFAF